MEPERALWSPPPDMPRRRGRDFYARLTAVLAVVLVLVLGVAFALPQGGILPRLDQLNGFGEAATTPALATDAIALASIGPSPSPTTVRPTPTPLPSFHVYIVKTGDNLNSIARRFDTTARSIAYWNRATYPSLDPESSAYKPGHIEIGWRLQVIPGVVVDEDDLPSPSPVVSASATPSRPPAGPTPTPTRVPITTDPSIVIAHGDRTSNRIALTFDMGGRLDPAVDIMELLASRHVHATVFPTGEMGTTTERGRAALTIVRDHPELFALANHSWDHPDFTKLTADQIGSQLDRTERALAAFVGRTSRPFFRPPYGAWNKDVRVAVGKAGWHYLVMWDIDTIDWRPTSDGGPTAADIEATVLANARGGSIVLMHLGGYHTLEALPAILDGLDAKGLKPVTLTEMLAG